MALHKSLRFSLVRGGTLAIAAIFLATTANVAATSRASNRWFHAPDGAVSARPAAADEGRL